MKQFPKNFIWGAATSAYQVEGNNSNSDWWPWEKAAGKENSGAACRHYELYEEDFDLAKSLNHNAHRLSIEWARIEPMEGQFSQTALQHYAHVIAALRSRNIEPIVTLHHFTNPVWLADLGGWANKKSVEYFARYCKFVTGALAKEVHYWITINEPTILLSHAYFLGVWPPQAKSYAQAKTVYNHMAAGHIKAYRAIHAIYKQHHQPKPAVSIAHHMQAYVSCTRRLRDRIAAYLRHKYYNLSFIDKINRQGCLDFIGINYYSRQLVELHGLGIKNFALDTCQHAHHALKKNALGWDIYPQGLRDLLLALKKYQLPVMITENGICTGDDQQRWDFLHAHLENIHEALEQGVEVNGYLYWSLLDNFEWDKGFAPRFGLIEVDYATFKRSVRESARSFAQVCESGMLS